MLVGGLGIGLIDSEPKMENKYIWKPPSVSYDKGLAKIASNKMYVRMAK